MAKVRRGQGVRLVAQILAVLVLSFLLWGILFFEVARTETALRREQAVTATLDEALYATGYVFRDEAVLTSNDNGPVLYTVPDGTYRESGALLATVYRDGANTGTRALAAELLEEIERLQRADTPDYLPDYYGAYQALMSSLSGGTLPGTEADMQTVQEALLLLEARREEAAAREARIAALQTELFALIENDLNASEQVHAPLSGVFYRTVDGYEGVMSTAAVETLTPGGLDALLLSPQRTTSMVGKLVVGDVWYLAVPMQEKQAEAFAAGSSYGVDFLRTGEALSLTVARVTAPDAEGEVLVILRAEGVAPPADLARSAEVRITVGAQSGLLVPMLALREEEGRTGVYVAEDGVARFRAVEVLVIREGCCLVAPASGDDGLQADEEILVTSRRIFEGKVLS